MESFCIQSRAKQTCISTSPRSLPASAGKQLATVEPGIVPGFSLCNECWFSASAKEERLLPVLPATPVVCVCVSETCAVTPKSTK